MNDRTYCYCTQTKRSISLDQTEGQCRDEHGCHGDQRCPLESQFNGGHRQNALEALVRALTPGAASR